MNKKRIVQFSFFFVLSLFLGYFWVTKGGDGRKLAKQRETFNARQALNPIPTSPSDSLHSEASIPPNSQAQTSNDEISSRAGAPALPSSAYFPDAKVVSSIELKGKAAGESVHVKIVETKMSQPYVRVEQTFLGEGKNARLVSEAAMIANQILVSLPDGGNEARFMEILRSAGALEIQRAGKNFLVTFHARPEDPRALEAFLAEVKKRTGGSATVTPNYIRKLFSAT